MISLAYPGLISRSLRDASTMAPLRHVSAVRVYEYSRKVWIVDVWVTGMPFPIRQSGLSELQAYSLQANILDAIQKDAGQRA